MAENDLTAQLRAGVGTAIAELNPELQDAPKRVIRGEITVFWPYSPLRDAIAFILAEPDFRLRRDRGTVRLEFTGASAKAVADLGLGGGDEVTLSLDGAAWDARDTRMPAVGTPLEWQLRFNHKLLALVARVAHEDTKLLNIDLPLDEAQQPDKSDVAALAAAIQDHGPEGSITPPRDPTPETTLRTKRPAEGSLEPGEFASPAFLKRARISYGSLFEGGPDPFDDRGDVQGKGRKTPKAGRFSSAWRYASRSPTPDVEEVDDVTSDDPTNDFPTETPSKQVSMVDGGCQTDELGFSPPHHVDVTAEPRIHGLGAFDTPSKVPADAHTAIPSSVLQAGPGVSPALGDRFAPLHQPDFATVQPSFNTGEFGQSQPNQQYAQDIDHSSNGIFAAQEHYSMDMDAFPDPSTAHSTQSHHEYPPIEEEADSHFASQVASYPPLTQGQTPPAGDPLHGSPHHTVFIDRIVEPQQPPWGFDATSTSYPDPSGEAHTTDVIDVPSSPVARSTLPFVNDLEEVGHDQGHEDASADPDDDIQIDDQDGPEEAFGAPTYSERDFEPSNVQSYATSRSRSASSGRGNDEEEMDAGGDYDITQYRNQSNVQDDDEGSDLESDFGQEEEEEIYNPRDSEIEEEQLDEDDEEELEGEDADGALEDYSEAESSTAPAPAKPNGPPEVIDLLSDSDDDDSSPVQRAAVKSDYPSVPQYDGSADEMGSPSGEEVVNRSDSSEDGTSDPGSEAASEHDESEVENEAEDEEDLSSPLLVEVPEDLREPTDERAASSPLLEDDLESMSPIKPLQVSSLIPENENIALDRAEADTDQLDAELEKKMQQTVREDVPLALEVRSSEILIVEKTTLVEEVGQGEDPKPNKDMLDTTPDEALTTTAPTTAQDDDTELVGQVSSPMNLAPSSPMRDITRREEGQLEPALDDAAAEVRPISPTSAIPDASDAPQDLEYSETGPALPPQVDALGPSPHTDAVAHTLGVDRKSSQPPEHDEQRLLPPKTSSSVTSEPPQQDMPLDARGRAEVESEEEPSDSVNGHLRSADATNPEPSEPDAAETVPEDDEKEDIVMEDRLHGDAESPKVSHTYEGNGLDTAMEDANAQLLTPHDTQQQEVEKEGETEEVAEVLSTPVMPSVVVTKPGADDETTHERDQKGPETPHPSTEDSTQSAKASSPVITGHRPETRSQTGHLPLDMEHAPTATAPDEDAHLEVDQEQTPVKTVGHRPGTRSQSRPQSLEPKASSPQPTTVSSPSGQENDVEDTPATKTRSQRQQSQSKTKADEVEEGDPSIKLARASATNKQKADQGDDPSVRLARGSIASRRSTRLSDWQPTPDTVRVTRAACHNLQKEATPEAEEDSSVQLAKAALNSPSRAAKERAEDHSPANAIEILEGKLGDSNPVGGERADPVGDFRGKANESPFSVQRPCHDLTQDSCLVVTL
ncbi:hypothetical protein BN1723_011555 [Verticillium longisporum]|uniref:Telomeric single stranded DNA binding POT1/Cdc13 domain-containing protein n=1 Tax=Verticillium longisporum TaxID=100787 RepID=A0A0G4L8V6_VERLO|nr:hypothetical protein BN1723_011555 [Verticillium longisporum]